MFFSNDILTRKGGQFSVVWLVGNFSTVHGSKRLGLKKSDYVAVDVVKACEDMIHPRTQFALRLSSTLLAGIIRIYQKQIHIVYDDVKAMWIFLKKGSFFRPADVELQGSLRNETFAIPDPLCYYDKEIGDERSDIRFYTSLGEKALFEAHKPVESHESRSDSAYFTISFGDQDIPEESANFENTMIEVREEPAKKRRRITKENLLDIIDETREMKMHEKSEIQDIQVPGEIDFGTTSDEPSRPNLLFDITEDQLDQTYAEISRDPVALDMLGNVSGIDTTILENIENMTEDDIHMELDAIPEMKSFNFSFQNRLPSLLDDNEQQFMAEEHAQQLETNSQSHNLNIEITSASEVPAIETLAGVSIIEGEGAEILAVSAEAEISAVPVEEAEISIMAVEEAEISAVTVGEEAEISAMTVGEEAETSALTADQTTEQGQVNFLQEMVLAELANRIENDPMLKEMSGVRVDKENQDPNNDKENQDPNAGLRRSARQKQPITVQKPAQEKAFDDSLGNFTLPEASPEVSNKRGKRKRQLIIDKKTQMSVKEMKKFMKKSREHLCVTPSLVHTIVPNTTVLFGEPHRQYLKCVPELHKLWKRCAHSGTHNLMELLTHQEEMDELEKQEKRVSPVLDTEPDNRRSEVSEREMGRFERSRRDSSMSEIEVGRFSHSSTNRQSLDESEIEEFQGGFRTSTVMKPFRDNTDLTMVSPIRHGSELNLGPLDFIMEESTILEQPSDLEPVPDVPSELEQLYELEPTNIPETTMDFLRPLSEFGELPRLSEMSDLSELPGPSEMLDLGELPGPSELSALGELPGFSELPGPTELSGLIEAPDLIEEPGPSEEPEPKELNPLHEMTLMDEQQEIEEPLNSSLRKPRTPLIERLSGLAVEEETTMWTAEGEKTFAHLESQKFYKFLKRKIGAKSNDFVFDDIVPLSHNRKTAALAFYQLLLLKKYNHVDVTQDDSTEHGRITIRIS